MEKTAAVRSGMYYGWVIVAMAAMSHFFSGPGQTYSNAIFIDYYIQEFGWSRSAVSGIYSAATLASGLLLFNVGRLIDSAGARKVSIAVSVLLALACLFNSFVQNAAMLLAGFFLIRLFGQGSMTLLSNSVVPQWFIQKRGRAMSIASLGGLVSAAAFPLLNVWLIEAFGWRAAWQVLGALVVLLYTPAAFIWLKNRPEDIGLRPDNAPEKTGGTAAVPEASWTIKEAAKTRAFWLLLFCAGIPAMVNTGLTFHLVSIFGDKSMGPQTAATVLSLMALIGFPVTFLAGWLLDKIHVRWMLIFMFAGEIVSIIWLQHTHALPAAVVFGIIWGVMVGLERITIGVVWPNYFGRGSLGSLGGISMSMVVIGSALGPLPFGLSFDSFGGYDEILWAILLVPLLGLIAAVLAVPPQKKSV